MCAKRYHCRTFWRPIVAQTACMCILVVWHSLFVNMDCGSMSMSLGLLTLEEQTRLSQCIAFQRRERAIKLANESK